MPPASGSACCTKTLQERVLQRWRGLKRIKNPRSDHSIPSTNRGYQSEVKHQYAVALCREMMLEQQLSLAGPRRRIRFDARTAQCTDLHLQQAR